MNSEFYKEYIRNHGHHYSGWYKMITFKNRPLMFFTFTPIRYEAVGVFCGAYPGHDCEPIVVLSPEVHGGEDRFLLTELTDTQISVIENAMLQGDKGEEQDE